MQKQYRRLNVAEDLGKAFEEHVVRSGLTKEDYLIHLMEIDDLVQLSNDGMFGTDFEKTIRMLNRIFDARDGRRSIKYRF